MTATLEHRAPSGSRAPRTESELAARLYPPMPHDRAVGWWVTIGITIFGGLLRFWDLASPRAVVFDETYYMKDAFSLLRWGYEKSFADKANDKILAGDGSWRTLDVFGDGPAFIVHPPVGKWTIAVGEYAFGLTPFGWRFATALVGTILVLVTVRVGRRLTRSTLIGGIAGFLVAIDGMAIVMSRTALLDGTLALWVLVGFGCLLLDRDRVRRHLATQVLRFSDDHAALRALGVGIGPGTGWRPWRWAAGFALGMACATKWSGIWFVVAFGVMTVLWDYGMRRLIGVRTLQALGGAALEGILAFVAIVGTASVVYLVSWSGWLLTDGGYDRNWAATNPASGAWGWVPDSLRSLLHYHAEMLNFHTHLDSPHSYQSNAWGWLLQTRPTSFWYESYDRGVAGCTADKCSAEVIALGNPIIWWTATIALLHQSWRWFSRRDWRSGAVVLAVLAGWLPWLGFQGRTIFTFYSVAFVPFLILGLAMMLGTWLGPADASAKRRTAGAIYVGLFLMVALAASWFFYPIWTGEVMPYNAWHIRMWFPTWV
ncbi:MAG TPA: phospholipid carrier-dependent glycosyltransferase [Candidatus Nanopelagicales bacterium]|nr:phospholipid carrier-dependent glycosyltransferase [Candidatus Nanopelagicales bacterium]